MLNGIEGIEGLTAEQQAQINKLAQGLADKNTDLLGKVNTGKEKASGANAELERLRILEQGLEQSKLEEAENYKGALSLKEQQYTTDLEKLTNGLNEKDQLIHKLLVENGLTAELVKLNVNPDLMGLIQQGLSATATVIDGQAMIGDESLSDYMKTWADTPQGKASRLAPGNSGGDGNGGGGTPGAKNLKDMTATEESMLANSDPVLYQSLLNKG